MVKYMKITEETLSIFLDNRVDWINGNRVDG